MATQKIKIQPVWLELAWKGGGGSRKKYVKKSSGHDVNKLSRFCVFFPLLFLFLYFLVKWTKKSFYYRSLTKNTKKESKIEKKHKFFAPIYSSYLAINVIAIFIAHVRLNICFEIVSITNPNKFSPSTHLDINKSILNSHNFMLISKMSHKLFIRITFWSFKVRIC